MPPRAKTPSPRKKTANPKASPSPSKPRAPAAAPLAAKPPVAGPPAEGEPKIETTISASRGLVDFLATHRLSFALTSYQTGQLMLIGVLPGGRLSVFQRNFARAMGLASSPQTLYLASIAQVWARKRAEVRPDREQAVRQALRTA